MRILFYRYGSICEPDYSEAFRKLDIDIVEITEEVTNKELKPSEVTKLVSDALFGGGYDAVFTINFYPVISAVCQVFQLRYICQTVDSPVHELYAEQMANDWNRVFLFCMDQYRQFAEVNPGRIFHLPLATNPERWQSVIVGASDEEKDRFRSEVSFVGSLYTEKNPYTEYDGRDPYLAGYLEGAMQAQLRVYGFHFLDEIITDEITERFRQAVPTFYTPPEAYHMPDKEILIRHYMDAEISVKERIAVCRRIGEKSGLTLYTASDTTGLPVDNRGTVKTLTEMPLVFSQSRINLNPTTKGIREGLSLRIFDVLGCGGFLITNYQAELGEWFEPGVDLEVYGSLDELEDKVEYYLSHEEERAQIARNGLEKVRQYHNYTERVLQMLELAFSV